METLLDFSGSAVWNGCEITITFAKVPLGARFREVAGLRTGGLRACVLVFFFLRSVAFAAGGEFCG